MKSIQHYNHKNGRFQARKGTKTCVPVTTAADRRHLRLVARAAEIQAMVDGDENIVAQAAIYNPCDCDAGTPLWHYKPARRTFSFANLSGNVERFEARCENRRVQGPVEVGTEWALAWKMTRQLRWQKTMSWIKEIEVSEADGALADTYAQLEKQRGKISNILKVHSLNPAALENHLDLYMTLMFGKSGLSRLEREAVAVVVSASNECEYCINHHTESLRHYLDDEETLTMLATADGLETLEPRLSNIVRHAEKLTTAPGAMTESDLGELRAEGLSDKDILDLTMIVGYFNFVNRIAMGLGVTFSAEELSGYLND